MKNSFFICLVSLLFLFVMPVSFSEEVNYRHYIDEKGNVVFVQKLEWQKYDNIDSYRIEIEELTNNSKYTKILDKTLEDNFIEIKLLSGTYRYRVEVYNVLGNLETRSEWKEFKIFKATSPKIERLEESEIVITDKIFINTVIDKEGNSKETERKEIKGQRKRILVIHGENLLKQSDYKIIGEGITEEGRLIDTTGQDARIEFNFTKFEDGKYRITVKNPGGLETESSEFGFRFDIVEIAETTIQEVKDENPYEQIKKENVKEIANTAETVETKIEPNEKSEKQKNNDENSDSVKKQKKPFNLDFDLDVSLGLLLKCQMIGKEYTEGKFYKEFFGANCIFPTFYGKVSFLPLKTDIGNFGIGILGDISHIRCEKERRAKSYELTGTVTSVLGEVVYQRPFGTRFILDAHIGMGIQSMFGFKYDFKTPFGNYESEKISSKSMAIGGGASVQINVWKKLYTETGIDFLYNVKIGAGTIEPKISVGWKF